MNDSYPDRTAQAAQPYLLLADELRRLGQRLDGIGDELLQLTGLGWPHPSPVPGGHVPAGPMPSGPMPIGPVAGYPPAAGYPAPRRHAGRRNRCSGRSPPCPGPG